MLTIRKATVADYDAVRKFYDDVIDKLYLLEFKPMWQKGSYPEDFYIVDSIKEETLYIGSLDGEILAAMIINEKPGEGYARGKWERNLAPGEYILIHTLGVMPTHARRGFAKEMVRYAMELGRQMGKKAIRLDVLEGNNGAEILYNVMGFKYQDEVQMWYESCGTMNFRLYEYDLG